MTAASDAKKILEESLKEDMPAKYLETGNVGLDLALTDGDGLPMGSSILLWATPGVGKTTVIGDLCKRLISTYNTKEEPFKVLYLDVENSGTLLYALGLGEYKKRQEFIHVVKPLCWRQIGDIYDCILNKDDIWKDIKVVVIDSVNSVLSDQNIKNSVADGDYGTRPRERSNFYSKFFGRCKEEGVTTILISQSRQKQGATQFEDPNKPAVSNIDLHYVDIILKCTAKHNATDASKVEEETVFGKDKVAGKYILVMDSKATGCKNRYIKGHAVEMMVERGKKVHNFYTIRRMLEANGYIKVAAGYYAFSPEVCETIGIPDKKVRLAVANSLIEQNTGAFIELLKKAGKYKVGIGETEVPASQDETEEE